MKHLLIALALSTTLILSACGSNSQKSITNETMESGLIIEDLEIGEGEEVKTGDSIRVHYRGTLEDGTEFDSSYKGGEPVTFPIGVGYLIQGWEQGIPGMKEGGKRKLTVPGDLAYGPAGVPAIGIPGNATLIFEIELLEVI